MAQARHGMGAAWHGRGMECVNKHSRTVKSKWERHNLVNRLRHGTAWQGNGMRRDMETTWRV
jgi:GH18 family chitinase